MARVRMTHPDLPNQPIDVTEESVPHYQASGWQVAEDTPAPNTSKQAARRRRQTGDES